MSMYDSLIEGIDALRVAGDALQSAADYLSDDICDYWAERGGTGRPPVDPRVDRLYSLADKVVEALEAAEEIEESLDA